MPRDSKHLEHELAQRALPCILAIPIGIASGAVCALFGRVLLTVGTLRDSRLLTFAPFLPLAGLLITWLYRRFGREAARGISLVFDVGHGTEEEIPLRLVPLSMATTWLTHLFGGSAGREGVAVQMGAAISHWVGRRAHPRLDAAHDGSYAVMGMAAGFAGLFHTPIAATLFAVEVLEAGKLRYRMLMPSLIGALCASRVSGALGLEAFHAVVPALEQVGTALVLKVMVLGGIFGLVGAAFAAMLDWAKQEAATRIPNPYARIALMGAAVSLLVIALFHGRYAGLGTNLISDSLAGSPVHAYDWALKLLLTVSTLAAGYQGGEVTPLFAIGASLGAVLGAPFGLDPVLVAALGYAAVFGGATNTLLAPVFIGCEVFGAASLPLFFIACAAAKFCNFNKSIYARQRVAD